MDRISPKPFTKTFSKVQLQIMEGEAGKRSAKTATAKGITKSKKFTSFFTARITPSSSNGKTTFVSRQIQLIIWKTKNARFFIVCSCMRNA